MHESEDVNEMDIVSAVLINGNILQILAGTPASDIEVIINSAQEHTEEDFRKNGYDQVGYIS